MEALIKTLEGQQAAARARIAEKEAILRPVSSVGPKGGNGGGG